MGRNSAVVRILRIVIRAVVWLVPWILQCLWFMVGLVFRALATFWTGVPTAVRRIANEWLSRAAQAGFPSELDHILYYICYGIALVMIVAGWIMASYLTVWLVQRILNL